VVTKEEINTMKSTGVKLIQAATNNDLLSVKSYIIDGIDVNSRDWDGLTPLIAASTNGHFNIVKHLIINEANPNLFDKNNITSIMETSMSGMKFEHILLIFIFLDLLYFCIII
jgi:ankyrin repeat protein